LQNWTNDHAKLIGRIIFARVLTFPLKNYRNIIEEIEHSTLFKKIPLAIKFLSTYTPSKDCLKEEFSSNIVARISKDGNSFSIRYTYHSFDQLYLIALDKLNPVKEVLTDSVRGYLYKLRRINSRNLLTHRILKGIIEHQHKYLTTGEPIDSAPFSQVQLTNWINRGQENPGSDFYHLSSDICYLPSVICNTWVSRLVNRLSVITPFGEERPLKWFFQTQKDVNKRLIKQLLDKENEDMQAGRLKNPYTDNELMKMLEALLQGKVKQHYSLSRWTVGHCRKDMGIPPAKRRLSGYKYPPLSLNFSAYYPLTKESIQQNCSAVSGVYEFCVKDNNVIEYPQSVTKVFYIGSTTNIKKRLRDHLSQGNKNGTIRKFLKTHQCLFRYIKFPHAWKEEERKLLELFFSTYSSLPKSNKLRGCKPS